jgi:hypothetical protein
MTTFVEVLEGLNNIPPLDLQTLLFLFFVVFLPLLVFDILPRLILVWKRNNWRFRTTHLLAAMLVVSLPLGLPIGLLVRTLPRSEHERHSNICAVCFGSTGRILHRPFTLVLEAT